MAGIDKKLASKRVVERWKLRCRTAKNRPGAGSFSRGNVLLVGERVSHPETKYHAPFCSVDASSGWLNTLLAQANIPEDQLFWINALDNDGTPIDLKQLADELQPRLIIGLGKVAERRLIDQGLLFGSTTPVFTVPHPQYWKRFRNHEDYPLITILKTYVTLV